MKMKLAIIISFLVIVLALIVTIADTADIPLLS